MKNEYKVVIIDDDELAVDNLVFELKMFPHFSVEGNAKNAASGRKLIFKAMPDLLFLDVELPDMQGSELLNLIRNEITWNMQIIFYTAYNKYMLDALKNTDTDEVKIIFNGSINPVIIKPVEGDSFLNIVALMRLANEN